MHIRQVGNFKGVAVSAWHGGRPVSANTLSGNGRERRWLHAQPCSGRRRGRPALHNNPWLVSPKRWFGYGRWTSAAGSFVCIIRDAWWAQSSGTAVCAEGKLWKHLKGKGLYWAPAFPPLVPAGSQLVLNLFWWEIRTLATDTVRLSQY